jgi:hypothetical protein
MKWDYFIVLLLGLILALFFLAPMPVLLFRALSPSSTMCLLMGFQVLFFVFVSIDRQPDITNPLLIALAYGSVLWSCASNWLKPL